MCGIFGYIGNEDASKIILEGLKRLEYRGYDSWGIAVAADEIKVDKNVGAIGDLDYTSNLPKTNIGVGHTRWATHGGITKENAHPHFSTDKSFVLAQNGIVENYLELKNDLKKIVYRFETETDTEVIVRLVECYAKTNSLKEAVREAFKDLKGRNTIIVLSKNGEIIAARNGSPLVIGINENTKEIFISSDTLSFAPKVSEVIVVDNGQMVFCSKEILELYELSSDKKINFKKEKLDIKESKVDKEGYDHFMLKEIYETPYVVNQIVNSDLDELIKLAEEIKKAKNVYTIGSGTAGVAACQIAFYLKTYSKINAKDLIGAETEEIEDLIKKDDLIIAPSQSGETADVLEVLERLNKKQVKIASIVNMQGSSLSRLSDFKFYNRAGPEICVMSTKVFTSQIAWGYLLSKTVEGKLNEGLKNLSKLSKIMEEYLNSKNEIEEVKKVSDYLSNKKDIFLLGKAQNLNIVKEGMIKIIEGSYIHAHGIPSGDLKHYAITLMEKGVPVVILISEDKSKEGVLNAVNEVKARGADVIGVAPKNYEKFNQFLKVPDLGEVSAIFNIVTLQLLAYFLAVKKGTNIDKPRNIAKSVTVK